MDGDVALRFLIVRATAPSNFNNNIQLLLDID